MSREFFYFQNPGGVVSLSGTFLGEISDFSRRMGWSAVFSSCCVAALQACETRRLGPPSRIADPGLFWAIFQICTLIKEVFCVARVNTFEISRLVMGLVTVDGNSGGRGRVFS